MENQKASCAAHKGCVSWVRPQGECRHRCDGLLRDQVEWVSKAYTTTELEHSVAPYQLERKWGCVRRRSRVLSEITLGTHFMHVFSSTSPPLGVLEIEQSTRIGTQAMYANVFCFDHTANGFSFKDGSLI